MSDPFLGEIRMFAGNFAPRGWAFCDGQLLAISGNQALFSLVGTIYGGDGETTFGLPDLRGRVPIHQGRGAGLSDRRIGSSGGAETVTVTADQLPAHSHDVRASTAAGTELDPTGQHLAASPQVRRYRPVAPDTDLDAGTIAPAGSSQAHPNVMPYGVIHFIIALVGIYPSPT